jgi:hypothetical protein
MWHISQKSEEIPSFELHENALLFSMQVHNSNHGRAEVRLGEGGTWQWYASHCLR